MRELTLSEAQEARADLILEQQLEARLLALGAGNVGPDARKKLMPLLKHYAKKRKPFTACVRDNRKRFGQKGAEKICATLKDIIRGTTKWRGHKNKDKGSVLSEHQHVDHDMPDVPEDVVELLMQLSDSEIDEIVYGGAD
jgi:hypothetical protein